MNQGMLKCQYPGSPLPDQCAAVQKVWGQEPDKQDLYLGFVTGQLCEPVATESFWYNGVTTMHSTLGR